MQPQSPRADVKRLALATIAALAVAVVVLVVAILPAEFGVDPTGVGGLAGLTKLAPGAVPAEGSGIESPESEAPPSATSTLSVYAASFPLSHASALEASGYLADGDTALVPVPVRAANVTRVIAKLAFADANETGGQATRPDLFEVQVKAPNGDVGTAVLGRSDETTQAALVEAELAWRAPPSPRELEAASAADAARAFRANDPADASAAGEWTVRVTLVEAGGAEANGVPLPGALAPATDAGNDWSLVVTVESFDLAVVAKPGSTVRQDTTTFTLAPGEELEYKLLMSLGKKVEYAWRTQGPALYVDFHGEKTDDASGAFTRHKNGEFPADSGVLVAPFDGRHGWFWRNSSGERVTLTLETKGAYDVIGVV